MRPNLSSVGWFGLAALTAHADNAWSDEARMVRELANAVEIHAEASQAMFSDKAEAIDRLWAIVGECSHHGWDGYDASPISLGIAMRTESLIKTLPEGINIPDIVPEADGAIALEWSTGKSRVVSMSLDEAGRVAYAWLIGDDRGHAAGTLHSGQLPARLLGVIRDVYTRTVRFGLA